MNRPPSKAQAERFEKAAERLDNIHERFRAVGIELTSGGLTLTPEEAEEILLRLEAVTVNEQALRPSLVALGRSIGVQRYAGKPCSADAFCVLPDGHEGQHAQNRDRGFGGSGEAPALAEMSLDAERRATEGRIQALHREIGRLRSGEAPAGLTRDDYEKLYALAVVTPAGRRSADENVAVAKLRAALRGPGGVV